MASVGGDDAEAAFLKAMRDQNDEETSIDAINATSTKNSNEEYSPEVHPDDILKVNFDDDDDAEGEPITSSSEGIGEIQSAASPQPAKPSGSGGSTPQNQNIQTPALVPPAVSSDVESYAVSAEPTPEAQSESKGVELAGPFVIEQDDIPMVPAQTVNNPQAATLTYQENNPMMDSNSKPTLSGGVQTTIQNVPVLNISNDALTSVSQANENVSSPTMNQGKKKRLTHDIVGKLEDRIAQDSRGDLDAWLALINEHQKKGKLEDARGVYERFLTMFPTAADQWIAYCQMELEANNLPEAERLFQRCLPLVPNVELWSVYLDYIRRRNNLVTDTDGKARSIVTQVYEFVLSSIGIDKEAGKIWQEYIAFIKSGPGTIGGSAWQDQQKMDHLRKVFQRATCIPVNGVEAMWKEYDQFEMGLNKTTGRKFISEKSPAYMTARSSLASLRNTTNGLIRATLPRLPPVPGFDGYEEYMQQVELWKKWIQWEKNDPLVLAQEPNPDDLPGYNNRVLYVYKQALMALRFWPEMWFEAAEFCFSIGRDKEGVDMLTQGMKANPESCLLHFRYAEYLESSVPAPPAEDKEAVKRRSLPVREVYDKILEVYYNLLNKAQEREKENIARLEEAAKKAKASTEDDDDEDYEPPSDTAINAQIAIVKDAAKQEALSVQKIISAIWINLMRTMRRIEGHGKVGDLVGGSRQVFTDARKRGKITSDVYVASALMEFHCYKDPSANRIFDRGMKMFPEDEDFVLEYLRHLISTNDLTNARAVFETFVGKVTPEKAANAKRVYQFFYDYESQYGELSQIQKLERRMKELYPQDPQLKLFQGRHSYKILNPSSFSPVVSQTQIRPKQVRQEGRPQVPMPERSPKRQAEDSDGDVAKNERPRKIPRGESPIKGAAGRRLMDQKRAAAAAAAAANREKESQQTQSHHTKQPSLSGQIIPPAPLLPDSILFLLSILPGAPSYRSVRFNPEEIFKLLSNLNIPPPPPNQVNGVSYFSSPEFYELLQAIAANQHTMESSPQNFHVNGIVVPEPGRQVGGLAQPSRPNGHVPTQSVQPQLPDASHVQSNHISSSRLPAPVFRSSHSSQNGDVSQKLSEDTLRCLLGLLNHGIK
ncbi:hypothetical protein ABW19_dt0202891 [Dactylella cylindrospora]|nr:hypothetical protein ABW19_dt0202891 [Dactylella cylindrospora]